MIDASQPSGGWHRIARAVPGGVSIQERMTLAYVSPTFASLAGRDWEALTGADWQTMLGPADAETVPTQTTKR